VNPAPAGGFDLAFPRALGPPVGSARLRAAPEDFQVDELLPAEFAFSGAGEHLCLRIRKRGQNSRWVAGQLAAAAGVAASEVGFCGLKDRQALTTQWFSVPAPDAAAPDLSGLDAEVLDRRRHRARLRRGDHAGNRFRIRLRDFRGDRARADARLRQIGAGVPNYFGPQRFGIDGGNLLAADRLLARRRIRGGGRNGIYLSAARSWLFNLVLAARVRDGSWRRALPGEPAPEGPLWGRGRAPAAAAVAALEARVLAAWGHWCHALEHTGLRQERRPLVLVPEDWAWHWQGADLVLEFGLGRGQFATAVLAELGDFAALGPAGPCAILPATGQEDWA
jgi:tRNA pseudouridine13 synthase